MGSSRKNSNKCYSQVQEEFAAATSVIFHKQYEGKNATTQFLSERYFARFVACNRSSPFAAIDPILRTTRQLLMRFWRRFLRFRNCKNE
jgi:hypothetical protein